MFASVPKAGVQTVKLSFKIELYLIAIIATVEIVKLPARTLDYRIARFILNYKCFD